MLNIADPLFKNIHDLKIPIVHDENRAEMGNEKKKNGENEERKMKKGRDPKT